MEYFDEALKLHEKLKGKIRITNKMDLRSKEDLSLLYSPGKAEPCRVIHKHPSSLNELVAWHVAEAFKNAALEQNQ